MPFHGADSAAYDTFRELLGQSSPADLADSARLEIIDWDQSNSGISTNPLQRQIVTVAELGQRKQPSIRIIFAPIDYPNVHTFNTLLELFRLYSFPSHYLHERIQSVTHSLGFENIPGGGYRTWFHFLCRSINLEDDKSFWIKSGYFLQCETQSRVTLICFGASNALKSSFGAISHQAWQNKLKDPYSLFAVVLSDLHLQMDDQLSTVSDPIRKLENSTIHAEANDYEPHFVNLHNLAKDIIYLKEGSEAILRTIAHMEQQRQSNGSHFHPSQYDGTVSSLRYHETLFESVNLRVISLEKRMQNMINLAFNLVAQKNSNVVLQESSSMHTIAITALIFLPVSTVATIFGSQFFTSSANASSADTTHQVLQVSSSFWIFWVVSVPLTLFVLGVWLYLRPNALPLILRRRRLSRSRV